MADYLDGKLPEELHIVIVEGLAWSHHDTLSGMDAERVEVFHVADSYAVVVPVPDHLVFYFFPALQRFLDKDLRRKRKGFFGYVEKLFLIVAESGSESSESIGRTQDHRISEFLGCNSCLLYGFSRVRLYRLDVYLVELLYEKLPVFSVDDGLYGGAEHFYIIFGKHSRLVEFDSAVQGSLSAESQKDALRRLFLYDLLDEVWSDGKKIYLVRHFFGCLHRSDVRVDKHSLDSLFFHGLQCLRTGIVELTGLAYLQGAGTEEQYFLYFVVYHFSGI